MNAMEVGGVEVGVLSLLKSKLETSYRVLTVGGCDPDIYQSLTDDEKSRLYICNGYFKALWLLLKLKPKMVVSSLWRAHFVSLLYKMVRPSTKRIHFVHSARFAHLVDEVITRMSLAISYRVLCDSENTQRWLLRTVKTSQSTVIPMNVSFSNQKKCISFYPINFVYVGRFCKEKNLLQSLAFIKLLICKGIECSYNLYGRDDGELAILKSYVEKNKLSSFVKFHNSILPTDIESEMRKYNYYLQSSLVEGMAISVFQAIKNGLLAVVTPVGEISNYTSNGFNAYYLDISDLKHSAEQFKLLIDSNDIENFNPGEVVNEKNYPVFDMSFFSAIKN